jgi:SLT domain-containing protein
VRESSYNPDAVNNLDVNARGPMMPDGSRQMCSRDVLQTIPPTFATNHQPGTSTNIYDPIANTAAAMNYVMKRYGVRRDGSNLAAAVCQFNPNYGPRGY